MRDGEAGGAATHLGVLSGRVGTEEQRRPTKELQTLPLALGIARSFDAAALTCSPSRSLRTAGCKYRARVQTSSPSSD